MKINKNRYGKEVLSVLFEFSQHDDGNYHQDKSEEEKAPYERKY